MHVQVEQLHSLVIVRPIGRFYGGDETAELEHKLGALIDGTRNIIIDLERTRDLNSIAIGALLAAHRQALAHAAQLALCNADRGIENVLTILKLVNVLPVYADQHAAVAAFGPRTPTRTATAAA
jgi:anti-anti-sigma factor